MREPRFEVLWYEGPTEFDAVMDDFHTKEFYTRKKALAFYEKHRNDENKYLWMVSHRNANWKIIERIK